MISGNVLFGNDLERGGRTDTQSKKELGDLRRNFLVDIIYMRLTWVDGSSLTRSG